MEQLQAGCEVKYKIIKAANPSRLDKVAPPPKSIHNANYKLASNTRIASGNFIHKSDVTVYSDGSNVHCLKYIKKGLFDTISTFIFVHFRLN